MRYFLNNLPRLLNKPIWLIGFVIVSLTSGHGDSKPQVLKVGALLSLTGDYAVYGTELQRGMQLAMKKPAAECAVELSFQDIATMSGHEAASAAQLSTSVETIDVGLIMGMDEALQMAPIFTRANTPLLVMWDSNDLVKSSGPLVFSNGFSTEGTGRAMAEFATRKLNAKRIALVANNNPWSTIVVPAFRDAARRGGGEVVYESTTEIDDRDFRTTAAKIKNLKVDAVFLPFALPSTAAEFAKQIRAVGYVGHLLGSESFSGDAISLAGAAAEGVFMSWIYTDSVPTLLEEYRSEFRSASPQPEVVAMGADAMWAIQRACKGATDKGTTIVNGLHEMFGPHRALAKVMKVFKIQGGKPIAVE